VDIAGDIQQIAVGVDKECFVAPLVEMAAAMMRAIEVRGIGDVEVAHELLDVAPGRADEQMEMIAHKDKAQNVHLIDIGGPRQALQEGPCVVIRLDDLLTCIAPAGDMIKGIRELDA